MTGSDRASSGSGSDRALGGRDSERALAALLELMAHLRDPERGCPWDVEQTFKTIAPYTIEEAYEVAEAIEREDPQQLRDELGDLLFQVVFHAQMARERGWFDFAAVATAIHEKLVRRHPHVFGNGAGQAAAAGPEPGAAGARPATTAAASELLRQWEEQKARERSEAARRGGETEPSALADVPRALPALVRAAKLGRRAARVGFDWDGPQPVRDKVLEEIGEIDRALTQAASPSAPEVVEEFGDLLFAVDNWTRHLKIDAEEALRSANSKFETRFRRMESLARQRGLALESLSAAQWDALWREVKKQAPAV